MLPHVDNTCNSHLPSQFLTPSSFESNRPYQHYFPSPTSGMFSCCSSTSRTDRSRREPTLTAPSAYASPALPSSCSSVNMSATQTQPEQPAVTVEKPALPAATPRKRRRRAPATGAADDCFTCQERSVKCDRRRPYCTPCLESEKDCSGYKTALTWGVGVASRGKLRGLSLPIASSKRAVQSGDNGDGKSESPPRKLAKLGATRRASDPKDTSQERAAPTSAATTSRITTPTNYGFVNMDPTSSAPASAASPMHPPPSFDWRQSTSLSQSRGMRFTDGKPRRHNLQPLQVPAIHPARDYGVMPMTASVVGGYGGNHDFGLSSQISPMVPTFTGCGIVSPVPKVFSHPSSTSYESNFFTSHNLGWTGDAMTSSVSSDHSSQHSADDMQAYYGSMDNILPMQSTFPSKKLSITSVPSDNSQVLDHDFSSYTHSSPPLLPDDTGDRSPLLSRSLPSLHIGNTPKLQFLIDYYDKVISPVIVAFDGPTNPYRSHILSLAVESETLQHAIAALSASNLRMRRSQNPSSFNRSIQGNGQSSHDQSVRRSSFAHSLMDTGIDQLPQTPASEPSAEELYHKSVAVKGLNEQLADPKRRQDDSILASLLILCLYHICDTGVARFRTQFAGVKKILALRGGTKGCNSKASNWLTIMFTWFEAMTATTNERESQLSGDDLDFSQFNSNEWVLENLAGCDGRLFQTIAKLGRLNLLSQNKPVASPSPRSPPNTATIPHPPLPSLSSSDYYSMSHARFDGNGWSELPSPTSQPLDSSTETRAQFWKEWTSIRQRLHEWQLSDSVHPNRTEPSTNSQADRRDLFHISESFRYSALLYTERLAYPHLPSAHPNFQTLVTQALYHIANVESDVFLLWPLFITGTECVSEQGRYLIRERCLDIQKDSGFFNNISGLELLEKVWRDDDAADDGGGKASEGMRHISGGTTSLTGMAAEDFEGGGFRWRRAMERVDGEYIVV